MRVYVSYDHSDRKFAAQLRDELVARGLDVWNPESELAPGSNWLMETGRALQKADAIVFVLSKKAVRSPYIQKEIDYALTNKRFANRVYPVVLGTDVKIAWILRELGPIEGHGAPKWAAGEIARSLQETIPPARLGNLRVGGFQVKTRTSALGEALPAKRRATAAKKTASKTKAATALKH